MATNTHTHVVDTTTSAQAKMHTMNTRYRGTKTPFTGKTPRKTPITKSRSSKPKQTGRVIKRPSVEELGERLFVLARSVQDAPLRPHEHARPSEADPPRFRERAPSPEAVPPRPVTVNTIPEAPADEEIEWNPEFDYKQPEGTGPGLIAEEEPDPLYNVKRISGHFRVPDTNLTEHWVNGERRTYHRGFEPWVLPKAGKDPVTGVWMAELVNGVEETINRL